MDYDYWLRCSACCLPGRANQPFAQFRVHKKSKGSLLYDKQFREDTDVIKRYTKNPFIIFIHKVADKIVILVYRFLK